MLSSNMKPPYYTYQKPPLGPTLLHGEQAKNSRVTKVACGVFLKKNQDTEKLDSLQKSPLRWERSKVQQHGSLRVYRQCTWGAPCSRTDSKLENPSTEMKPEVQVNTKRNK